MPEMVSRIDDLWVLLATVLVLLMLVGFTCIEAGRARAKNSINVAIKNLVGFLIAAALFWVVGFGLMYGASWAGLFGTTGFLIGGRSEPDLIIFFLFQMALCAVAVALVSGAVAERMRFGAYMVLAAVMALFIYPVIGHWVWGDGWLHQLGFVDFAGATAVHAVGGWVALAAVLLVGPRLGRFGPRGRELDGQHPTLSALGVFFLWLGWFGFTGGASLSFDGSVPAILLNTNIAAIGGGLAAMFAAYALRRRWHLTSLLNGAVAGLVAITAACHVVDAPAAAVIGIVGGLLCLGATATIARCEIDDAVGVIPAHLAAAVWGTLAVALFGDPALWASGHSRGVQLGIQLLGVGAAGAYAFGAGYLLLWAVGLVGALRVTPEVERVGLNAGEHGASTEMLRLLQEMELQRLTGDFSEPVMVEPETEAGQVAAQYNLVLGKVNAERAARDRAQTQLESSMKSAEAANEAKTRFLANVSHELRTPLNAIVGFADVMDRQILGDIGNERYKGYIGDIKKSGRHLAQLIEDLLDFSRIENDQLRIRNGRVDLLGVLSLSKRMLEQPAESKRIDLSLDTPDTLPVLTGDERALKQVFTNLIGNAVKFTPEGGRVAVSAKLDDDGALAIRVSDNGRGIPEEDIDRVMEPFVQITDPVYGVKPDGVGLGLPLARSLVQLHGGELTLESTPGGGTVATVRLPGERVRSQASAQPSGPRAVDEPEVVESASLSSGD